MRIAAWYNLPAGGAKRALHDHVEGLLGRRHHVEAWCPPTANRSFLPLSGLVHEHVVPLDYEADPPWWRPGRLGALRSPMPLARAVCRHARACAEKIDSAGFDICLAATCQFFGTPPIGRYLSTPCVLYLQEPNRWLYEANPDLPWLTAPAAESDRLRQPARSLLELLRIHRRSQRARFEVDNAHAVGKVLVNSLFSRETVLRVYGIDADVCYLGIDLGMFRPTGATREDIVIGVGALAKHKGAHLVVEAVGELRPPRPRVVWVGASRDERYTGDLRMTATRLGVELEIRDLAGDKELVELLSRARALVYAPRLEPFGLVPLEANACELPVVATAEGGLRETVVDELNGLVVGSSPREIAAGVERLRKDPAFAAELGRQGRALVERDWTAQAAALRLEDALMNATQAAMHGTEE